MTKKLSAFLSEVSNLTEMPTQHLVCKPELGIHTFTSIPLWILSLFIGIKHATVFPLLVLVIIYQA